MSKKLILIILLAAIVVAGSFAALAATQVGGPEGATVVLDGSISMDVNQYTSSLPSLNVLNNPKGTVPSNVDTQAPSEYSYSHMGYSGSWHTYTFDYGGGEKEFEYWITGAWNGSLPTLDPICSSNNAYAAICESDSKYDEKWNKESIDSISSMYSIRLNGINKNANNYETVIGSGFNGAPYIGSYDRDWYTYAVEDADKISAIYPDKYDDLVYPLGNDLAKLVPWYSYYPLKGNGEVGNMDYRTARELYQAYKGAYSSTYFKRAFVNNKYKELSSTNHEFMASDIRSFSSIMSPQTYNGFWFTGNLSDRLNGNLPTGAYSTSYKSSYETNSGSEKKYTEYEAGIYKTNVVTSTWQVSIDNETWQTVLTGSSTTQFSYNCVTHYIKIGNKLINLDPILEGKSTFYVRRIGNYQALFPGSAYAAQVANAVSPSMRVRSFLSLDGIDYYYTGSGVVERMYLDPKDVKIIAHYSTGDKEYAGNGSYTVYTNTRIMNVGDTNYVRYTFTCPLTGTVLTGTFQVKGLERTPQSISARYIGDDVIEDLSYDPSLLMVTVTYNNGTTSVFMGTDASIGTLTEQHYGTGDLDLNTAINGQDLSVLNEAIAGNYMLSTSQQTQADLNKDGIIDGNDVARLESLISRKVPLNGRTFYATYAHLMNSAGTAPLYAQFNINGVAKSPDKLVVTKKPTRTSYIEGEAFKPAGMILTIYYDNGTYRSISWDGTEDTRGLTIGSDDYPASYLYADQPFVPIVYKENGKTVSTQVNINVKIQTLTSIKITRAPDRVIYYSGENFLTNGMEVTAYYDEGINNHTPATAQLSAAEYELTNYKKLKDSRDMVLFLADTIDISNADTLGYVSVPLVMLDMDGAPNIGDHGTYSYSVGTSASKTITGTVVGNNLVKVSFTSGGITKFDYQPIVVKGRRLSSLEIQAMPTRTEYQAGQSFDTSGLILKAGYTDGTRDYIYPKTELKNGYTIVDGNNLSASQSYIVAEYVEDEGTEDEARGEIRIPITVIDPNVDSIQAVYVGGNIVIGQRFDLHEVTVIVSYTDGTSESFRADETNPDGTYKVRIVPAEDDGSIDMARTEDNTVYSDGNNVFGAIYSGKTATFIVKGVGVTGQMDFTNSIARGKRKTSTWTEQFTATKIKSVADYIRGEVNDFPDVSNAEEYHNTEPASVTDTRTYLSYADGTGRGIDPYGGTLSSPVLNFVREGTWRQPETVVSVQYRGRTKGYLYPENNNEAFKDDLSYITSHEQSYATSRDTLQSYVDEGWSDWASNGDSVGTVQGNRTAYNYTSSGSDSSSQTMALDRLKIKLTDVPAGDTAGIHVISESVSGESSSFGSITENDTIVNPARINMNLVGTVTVIDNEGNPSVQNFSDVYKIFYRAAIDDSVQWSEAGEWAGYTGTPMQNIEIRIMLKDASFDKGSMNDIPVISQNARNASTKIGSNATFAITAVGNTLRYQWYKNGQPIAGATGPIYTTPECTASDNGSTFYCIVTNGSDHTAKSATVTLTVRDQYPAITKDIANVEESIGTEVTFTVEATCANPSDLQYEWQYADSSSSNWSVAAGASGNQLTLVLTQAMHGRRIRCKVQNSAGYVYSNTATINCKQNPEAKITCVTDYLTVSRAPKQFTCETITAAAGGITSYQWIVKKGEVETIQSSKTDTMSWIPTSIGNYTIICNVEDSNGKFSARRDIVVGALSTVTIGVTAGTDPLNCEQIVLSGNIASYDPSHVQIKWYLDGELVSSSLDKNSDHPEAHYHEYITVSNDYKTLFITITDERGLFIYPELPKGSQHSVMLEVTDNFGRVTSQKGFTINP